MIGLMVGEEAELLRRETFAAGGGRPSPDHAPQATVLFTLSSPRALSSQLECRQQDVITLSRWLADVSPAP